MKFVPAISNLEFLTALRCRPIPCMDGALRLKDLIVDRECGKELCRATGRRRSGCDGRLLAGETSRLANS